MRSNQKTWIMTAKDFTEFHALVEQFQGEMSLKDICMQEGIDYRSYISWRKRMGYSRSRKPAAPATMVELEVMDLPSMPASAGTAKVHIEFENGLVLDRESMEVDRLTEFLDKIKPVLCLS
ncbi:hypothetical protein [uncultured Duncaniella sp.]|uniref:hypothetical protein n=1 Tax=uncultured Duncaniella sp. TaxID=2768039 RepID=UPI0025B6B6FA|nr:hypothetical protein [uncultured Duncaniella sp.]